MPALLGPLQSELLDHAVRGEWWEPEGRPRIPAAWIRDLVVGGEADGRAVHPKGVRMRGVAVCGALDFESASLVVPLRLDDVHIREPINMEQAEGGWISITSSRLDSFSAQELRLRYSLVLAEARSPGPSCCPARGSTVISCVLARCSVPPTGPR